MPQTRVTKPLSVRRTHDFRVHGHIPDAPVGTRWKYRQEVSDAGVHSGIIAGISGDATNGAYSVVLTKYYENEDNGDTFVYTGCGGHDSSNRRGPQIEDQSFEHGRNVALERSYKNKKPVRVIRGENPDSDYAPASGYRYDGLYTVKRIWRAPSKKNPTLLICRIEFERLQDQPPLPGTATIGNRKRSRSESEVEESPGPSVNSEPIHDSIVQAAPVKRFKFVKKKPEPDADDGPSYLATRERPKPPGSRVVRHPDAAIKTEIVEPKALRTVLQPPLGARTNQILPW